METITAYLIAGISTAAFLSLWFWVVHRELYTKQKATEAAKYQLITSKQKYMRARDSSKEKQSQEIMERSECVYRQSAQLYNELLRKPWNAVPGRLMGFHSIVI